MADTFTTLAANNGPAEKLLFALPDWVAVGSETAGTTTATAPGRTGWVAVADSAVVSFSAAPAGALSFQVTDGAGGAVLFRCEIPAAATAPIMVPLRGIRASLSAALVATMATAGGSTVQSIVMKGIYVRGS